MATLETLDILFKSSGKDNIIKDINDIEQRWSAITASIVGKMEAINKELNKINNSEKANVLSVEKEAIAKKTIAKEEKNISKAKGDVNKRHKLSLQEEKTAKQKEKYEKQREKSNRSERGRGTVGTGGTGGSGGDSFWGKWGGIASVASFAKSMHSKIKSVVMSSGDAVLDIMMASREASTSSKRINPKEMEKLFSRIVDTGLLSIPQSASILRDLASKYRGGFFGNDFWESLGYAGGKADTGDFFKVFESLVKVAKSGNLSQVQMEGFSRINENLLPILQYLPEYSKSIFPDMEKTLQTRKETQEILNQIDEALAKIGKSGLPALNVLSNVGEKITSFNKKTAEKIKENTDLPSEYAEGGLLVAEATGALLLWEVVKSLAKKGASKAWEFSKKGTIPLLALTPNTLGGDTWETMSPKMRESLKGTQFEKDNRIIIPPIPPTKPVSPPLDISSDTIEGKDVNINISVPENAKPGVYNTSIKLDQIGNGTRNELITAF